MDKLTLKKLYNTDFPKIYWKLLRNDELRENELETILAIGLYFTGLDNVIFQKFGYRLFLLYSNKTNDYKPLYELSLNKGLIPIAQFIEENLDYSEEYGNIQTEINSINNIKFKWNDSYKTVGQYKLNKVTEDLKSDSQIIVAPTSYGKTEMILSFIKNESYKKICVITPTKSLLAQTKKRIINHFGYKKIITSPEMYNNKDDEIIAVLTQERLLRLLQNNADLKFDLLVIDEAHNLLDGFSEQNYRSVILGAVIIICNKRNDKLVCKYLTPFLKSKDSLNLVSISKNMEWYSVNETVKSEMYFFYDLKNNKKEIFDQYSGSKQKMVNMDVGELKSDADIVIDNCDNKNIVYLNNPKNLEQFAMELSLKFSDLDNKRIKKASADLKEYVHDDYKLANYVKKGIIYHHGSIPEQIRYFIEELYIEVPEIKMLIANSTLLEGVNIPATKMFILDPSRGRNYLSPSSFHNLVGRVCRFGEIFNKKTGNLRYLLPEIHIINGKYCRENFNAISFIKGRNMLVKDYDNIVDRVENPLLVNTTAESSKKEKAEVILENLSSVDIITSDYERKPKTKIGQLCFENNVNIFDILKVEDELNNKLDSVSMAQSLDTVFSIIDYLFFSKIEDEDYRFDNLKRLKEHEAQNFYKMLINWRIMGLTMKQMVNEIVGYWNTLREEQSKLVYVGKWGDKKRGGYRTLWTDITTKDEIEKVNLAIVRLKEEYDFIDNEIIKYVEILNSLNLIEEKLYLKIKYGTEKMEKIALLNCGISNMLSNLLYEKYSSYYTAYIDRNIIIFSDDLISEMEKNEENGILISEVKMNCKDS